MTDLKEKVFVFFFLKLAVVLQKIDPPGIQVINIDFILRSANAGHFCLMKRILSNIHSLTIMLQNEVVSLMRNIDK